MADLVDYGKQVAAGLLTTPGEIARLGSYALNPARLYRGITGQSTEEDRSPYGQSITTYGSNTLSTLADKLNNKVADALGVKPDPSLLDDTGEASAKLLGQSLPALPGALVRGAVKLAPSALAGLMAKPGVRTAANVVEALTPVTVVPELTAKAVVPRVALNVAAQGAVGGAVEAAVEPYDPTKPFERYDAQGNLTTAYYPSADNTPGVGRVIARGVGEAVSEHPLAAVATGTLVAAGAIISRRALRGLNEVKAEQALSDIVRPTEDAAAAVPVSANPIKRAATRVDEVLADSTAQTKAAVDEALSGPQAGTPSNPGQAQAVKDSIDLVSEASHRDRAEALLEQGRLNTPLGERIVGSIKRLGEELAQAATKRKELSRNVKELIAVETELDNRSFAVKNKAEQVMIDTRTGMEASTTTPPQFKAMVTPRATLHHLGDAELEATRNRIRTTDPDAVKYADRYWDIHSKLADAWVDFGLISASERAKWGRANPHFMHTINLDDPKSPRAYRYRGHRDGPQYAGDPFLAAVEYQDYMLAHVYRNRMRKDVIEALRSQGGGVFGNGKWLGKVAHPVEMAGTTMPHPTTGQQVPLTKEYMNLQGDRISYFDKGEKVDVEIANPVLLDTLRTMPSHAQTMLGTMRQLSQSALTGKLATILGQPFALANAIMGALFAQVVRPAGRSFGMLDRRVLDATGGKFGVRGDPTAYLGMIGAAGKDIRSIMQRTVADSLYASIDKNGMLSKILNNSAGGTGKSARQIADSAARKYMDSVYAERNMTGGGTASTLGDRDFDTSGGKASMLSTVSPHQDASRVVRSPRDLREVFQTYKRDIMPAQGKIAFRAITDVQEAIANMAQSYLYRTNRGKRVDLDTAARPLEQVYDQAIAPARALYGQVVTERAAYKQQQAFVKQAVASAKAATNPQVAGMFTQLASRHRQNMAQHRATIKQLAGQIDQVKLAAAPHKAAAEKARDEWFREVNSLGLASRQLLGDSAQMGSGLRKLRDRDASGFEKAVGWTLDAVPYGNIGLQAGARMLKAIKDNPSGTMAAAGMTLGPVVLLPMASAMYYDKWRESQGLPPEAVANELMRPGWHQARFAQFYIPGVPIDNQPTVRIDPILSFPYTAIREGMMYLAGWTGGDVDPLLAGATRDRIMEMVSERRRDTLTTSLLNMQPINQIPPIGGAVLGLAGIEVPGLDKLISRGGVSPIQARSIGGYEETRLNDDVIGKRAETAIQQFFGGPLMSWIEGIRAGHQAEKREPGSFFPAAKDTIVSKAQDRLPELQPLWPHAAKRATTDFIGDAVNGKESVIESVRANIASVKAPGTIGSGRYRQEDPYGGGRAGVADGDMESLLARTAQFGSTLDRLKGARTQIREQMITIRQRALPFADQRNEENRLATEIRRVNSEILAMMHRFEDSESNRLGRRIRLEKIDPSKPITQFPQE